MLIEDQRSIRPTRPVAPYVGGKRQLAGRVIAVIETIPHIIYCEPFVGMGGVFLRRRHAPKVEAINDASKDVACLFRILQRHFQAFMDMLKWQLTSRAEFERLASQDPDTLTDLERAARFLYLQRLSFGGKVAARSFGMDTTNPARFDVTKLGSMLEEVHERLAGVWIDCLPWQDFIGRWDRPGTLFYADPPYWGTEHYYGRDLFGRDDQVRLAETLRGPKGRFVLTLNDAPEVREMYSWAQIESADLSYQVGGGGRSKAVQELIVRSPSSLGDLAVST